MEVILPVIFREGGFFPCKRGSHCADKGDMDIPSCSLVPLGNQNLEWCMTPLPPWPYKACALPLL